MFKSKKFGNQIICSEGFEIHLASEGRDSLIYLENDRKMLVNSESFSCNDGIGITIWKNSIKEWEPPHEKEIVDDKKCGEIIDNIVRALEFAKFNKIEVK